MKKLSIKLFSFLLILQSINAQPFCTSELNVDRAKQISQDLVLTSRAYDGTRPMIRLALHRVIRTNGTGGFTWNEIRNWVETLPNVFQNFDICFTVVSEDNIANDVFLT